MQPHDENVSHDSSISHPLSHPLVHKDLSTHSTRLFAHGESGESAYKIERLYKNKEFLSKVRDKFKLYPFDEVAIQEKAKEEAKEMVTILDKDQNGVVTQKEVNAYFDVLHPGAHETRAQIEYNKKISPDGVTPQEIKGRFKEKKHRELWEEELLGDGKK